MKTELRLGSVVKHGVGGPEAGAIDLIYLFLLDEFKQDFYSRIGINQIGDDLEEFVLKEPGNRIHVNIRYPIYEDFEAKTVKERNLIRLDVVHTALLKVADQYKKLEIHKLEVIRKKIIKNNFSFDFICKIVNYKGKKGLISKIIVHPKIERFNYSLVIEEEGKEKCRIHLYSGLTDLYYFSNLFSIVKWRSINEIIITGKAKEVEMYIIINACKITFINLTAYNKAPYFEMMRADISQAEREIAHQDWLHSLPPAHAAIIRQSHN